MRGCTVEGCTGVHYALGRCEEHYRRMNQGDHILRKALKSDNLDRTGLTPSQEANLCAFARHLNVKP